MKPKKQEILTEGQDNARGCRQKVVSIVNEISLVIQNIISIFFQLLF